MHSYFVIYHVSDILLFVLLISSDVKSSTIMITYLTKFYILLFHEGHKINTKYEERVYPSAFYYPKLINSFELSSVLEVFAQGWQVNLLFLSISPVHIILALHEVQVILYICSQKWHVILEIGTWLEVHVSLGSATCIWNIFQYWCVLNKTKKRILWVFMLKINLQIYWLLTIGKGVGCVEWNCSISQADWKD